MGGLKKISKAVKKSVKRTVKITKQTAKVATKVIKKADPALTFVAKAATEGSSAAFKNFAENSQLADPLDLFNTRKTLVAQQQAEAAQEFNEEQAKVASDQAREAARAAAMAMSTAVERDKLGANDDPAGVSGTPDVNLNDGSRAGARQRRRRFRTTTSGGGSGSGSGSIRV